jgi:hypothetical protein
MFCAFICLLTVTAGLGVLAWFGWQRVASHLQNDAEATRMFVEHVVTPLLLGERTEEPAPEGQAQSEEAQTPAGGWMPGVRQRLNPSTKNTRRNQKRDGGELQTPPDPQP